MCPGKTTRFGGALEQFHLNTHEMQLPDFFSRRHPLLKLAGLPGLLYTLTLFLSFVAGYFLGYAPLA
ncbi:hypothetical protein CGL56_09170 [Neolewinella marina]|uniref:Uncharacterized protein n=1 Tax=Neolewinella marina TaxID=438751 RepID=A0A2G0CF84_9BACT|nr:hypothetical protein CGL56_09170 [Neolewinella marina]